MARALAPFFERKDYTWRAAPPSLEDVFIHLMNRAQRETASA